MNDYNFTQKFNSFEEIYHLNKCVLGEVPVWEIIRRDIFLELQRCILNVNFSKEKHGKVSLLRFINSFIKSCVLKNPLFIKKNIDIIFFSSSRKKKINGEYVDIYIDELCQNIKSRYAILERDFKYSHHTGKLFEQTYYYDLISFPSLLYSKIGSRNVDLDSFVVNLNNMIESEYGVTIKALTKIVRSRFYLFKVSKKLNEVLLNRINPKKIILYNSYNVFSQSLISAAKKRKIPTYELQHGTIGKSHSAYNYPPNTLLDTFPDYLLTWGEYHTKGASIPLAKQNIIVVGFPYLESQILNNKHTINEKCIIIISQRRVDIATYALEIAMKLKDYRIIFKAHPTEYHCAKDTYTDLAMLSNVQLLVDDSPNLYNLFSKSKYVLGVNSTALIEAKSFNCNVIIMDLPGSDFYFNTDDDMSLRKCNPNQFISLLENEKCNQEDIDGTLFFKKRAIENIKDVLDI